MYHKFFMNSRQCCIFTCIMKKLLFYIPVLALLMACSHQRYPSVLLTADSLCSTIPDSAVTLLNSLELEMKQADKATRTYYQLLSIKAADKAYITHTSDSLIREVLQHYTRKDDHRHLPEAYYYAGRVYRDLGDAPQALDYFQKAIETLPAEGEYELKSRIYSQMGTLFYYQMMYEEALPCHKNSLVCDISLKDTAGMILSLRDIAEDYWGLQKLDSTEYIYKEALQLSSKANIKDLTLMLNNQIAGFYTEIGNYIQAKNYLIPADLQNSYSRSATYSIAAKLYHAMGMADSASYYYKALLDDGTIYAKKMGHRGLAEIALEQNDQQTIISHLESYLELHDSIQNMDQKEMLYKMQSLYNYQLREKENHSLELKNNAQQRTILIIFIFALTVSTILLIYSHYHRRRHSQLERLYKVQQEQDLYNKIIIEENINKIHCLEEQLQSSNRDNQNLIIRLKGQKEIILKTNKLAQIEIERREQAKKLIVYTPIYQYIESQLQIKEQAKSLMTEKDWKDLENTIDNLYVGFIPRLRYLREMSDFEFRVCLLIKIEIKISDIARLTTHSIESISSVRRRLYEKIHKKKGTPKEWDDFILSL